MHASSSPWSQSVCDSGTSTDPSLTCRGPSAFNEGSTSSPTAVQTPSAHDPPAQPWSQAPQLSGSVVVSPHEAPPSPPIPVCDEPLAVASTALPDWAVVVEGPAPLPSAHVSSS